MRSIVYVSYATAACTDDEVVKILSQSRENNAREDITGLLLYASGNFIQALEGPEQTVSRTYQRIGNDPRHSGILLLADDVIEERSFPSWQMDFRGLRDLAPEQAEQTRQFLREVLDADAPSKETRAKAVTLLRSFRQSMR